MTAKSLSGADGTFIMRVNDQPGGLTEGDKLYIDGGDGSLTGTHNLYVANNGAAHAIGTEKVLLVETNDTQSASGAFTLANRAASNGEAAIVELGAFQYKLGHEAESDAYGGGSQWFLYGTYVPGPEPIDPDAPSASNTGSAAINTFVASYLLNYAEMDTLIQRLGDLRGGGQYGKEGAWFRAYGGKFKDFDRNYAKNFDMNYGGVQVGYDHRLENSWFRNGDTYVGAFIGFGKGDLDYSYSGSGTAENRSMGMYATYIGEKGFYVDAIAKYTWSRLDFSVLDNEKTLVTGDKINSTGPGLSLETGKRIRFGNEGKNGGRWYVEPQVQLSWQHMSGGAFFASNGLNIGLDSYNSLLGRAGILLGYQTNRTNFYAKASYVKEFDGDMTIRANDVDIFESLDDNWVVYGLGVTHLMNARNALYLDVERTSGGSFAQDWKINGGWRVSF